jgi:pathogenesis-related protein 1
MQLTWRDKPLILVVMRCAIGIAAALAACGSNSATSDAPGGHPGDGNPMGGDGATTDGPTPDVPGGVGEPPELMGITLYHNQVRAMVQTATPLPPLQWDPNLASYAAAWVAMCRDVDPPIGLVDHDPNRTNVAGYSYIGENIYASSGTATPDQAVQLWAAEKANYDYATNTCAAGQVCGHYTQVVWRDTLFVGCALHNCNGLTYPSTIVCDYGPGGNFGGQLPY